MSRWFRHYAGMMRDDKLVRVAIRSGQTIERVVWVWGAILESATEIDDGGRYDLDAAEIAYFLRTDEADIHSIVCGLEAAGRLLGSVVAKWGDRQFSSDRSRERQAAYRERQKAGQVRRNGDGLQHNAGNDKGDARVTSPSRHRDAPETELETEPERTTDNPTRAADCFNEICKAADWHPRTDAKRREGLSIIDGWLAVGCSLALILESIKYCSRSGEPTSSLRRFDGLIRKKRREQLGGELPVTANDVAEITKNLGKRMRAA